MKSRRKSISNFSRGIDEVRLRRNNNAQTANRFRRGLRRALNGDVVLDERFVTSTINRVVGPLIPSTFGTTTGGASSGGGGGGGTANLAITAYTSIGGSYVLPLTGDTLVVYLSNGTPYVIASGSGVVRFYDTSGAPYDVPLIAI